MYRDSLTAAVRRLPARRHVVAVGLLMALVFVVSVISVQLRFPGLPTAPWWPAAGIAVIAVLASRRSGLLTASALVVVTGLANLVVGTTWWVALGFGIANAAEAWAVASVLRYRRRSPRRFQGADSVRLLAATAAGAVVIGVLVGAVVLLDGGGFVETALRVAASHGSAVLLVTGLAIVPRSSFAIRRRAEFAVQVVVLAVALGVAFGRTEGYPLAFLPFPALAWAAFRFGSGVVLVEVVVASLATMTLSALGIGPFAAAADGDPAALIWLMQVYALSLGASMIPLAVFQDDRTVLLSRLSARAQLLRGAIVSAHAGFVVVRREDDDVYRVVESNANGERLLSSWLQPDGASRIIADGEVGALAATGRDGWTAARELPDGLHVELSVTPVIDSDDLVLIQAVDVTEQSRAARALADALMRERETLDGLRDLAAQKDEFVSSVSHELRTPVTSILGYAEELAESADSDEQRRSAEVIVRNAQRLAELVEGLLGFARGDEPRVVAALPVDVPATVGECLEELAPIARAAGIEVSADVEEGLVAIGDTLWIGRIVTNLLTNSVKFTERGGRVAVRAHAAPGGRVRIEVADTGRGIPSGEIERVFERFYRVTEPAEFVPGTGLGLPIVRDLATRMGGTVDLVSDGRRGTTAIVDLPGPAAVGGPA